MKKFALIFISIIILSGCSKENSKETTAESTTTPTSQATTETTTDETTKVTTEVTTEEVVKLDKSLEEAIRIELGIDESTELTDEMLKGVTYLAAFETYIDSLKGISLLENLTEIHVTEGKISDISELKELKNLTFIDISNCYISEIPDFSELTNLESLYLCDNLVEDISPVNNIKNLKYVNLSSNRIKSIKPLKEYKGLEGLSIDGNCILDYYTIEENRELIGAIDYFSQCKYSQCIEVEEKAKEIVETFPKNLTELELEKEIYQYIIDNMEYEVVDGNTTAFGHQALMEGIGVCGHYAEGFCLLANHAGLEAYVCGSDTHAWNIVNIDGKYYHCDALWDEGMEEWIYFNVGAEYMLDTPDHTYDVDKYPTCEKNALSVK